MTLPHPLKPRSYFLSTPSQANTSEGLAFQLSDPRVSALLHSSVRRGEFVTAPTCCHCLRSEFIDPGYLFGGVICSSHLPHPWLISGTLCRPLTKSHCNRSELGKVQRNIKEGNQPLCSFLPVQSGPPVTSTYSALGLGLLTPGRTMGGRRKVSSKKKNKKTKPKILWPVPGMSLSWAPPGKKRRKGPWESQSQITAAVIDKAWSHPKSWLNQGRLDT